MDPDTLGFDIQDTQAYAAFTEDSPSLLMTATTVPDLQGKSYMAFKLTAQDWTKIELMKDVLQEPANAQQTFSATHEPTVWRTIPVLEFLQETWENMAESLKFSSVSSSIHLGINNLHKWYCKVDNTDTYFICLVLDPTYKLAYAKDKWEARYYNAGTMEWLPHPLLLQMQYQFERVQNVNLTP
ncbi:uncharacterized protein EDB91DRAFT_1079481 [Suillus paluster]|uniref:uncharacterized protein n=1 Tax=Suillus paluster TaxID=48578 RepID=UPI001B878764|nr:uncharacterized protein EDB91DRAFT_1079481 [Suillus paluster]KAG1747754.1 hypothetical protein EDB91DRAFT_1079481 [Suillus paluster]